MHNAFESSALLQGYREKPDSLLVHGAKLFLGSSTGNLSVYRIDQHTTPQQPISDDGKDNLSTHSRSPRKPTTLSPTLSARSISSIQPLSNSQPVQVSERFSRRAIEQLGVIKETNTLVSLSDGYVSLHDLSTLGPQMQLTQTRGALTFAIDTSVQKHIPIKLQDYGPGPLGGMASIRGTRFNNASGLQPQAYRPGTSNAKGTLAGTMPRSSSGLPDSPSKAWQSASLRGMDAIIKHKEEERRRAMQGVRIGGVAPDANDGVMTLVTVLAVGLKRKLILFRWVDGEFWDTREVPLNHTPRCLAFPSPTKLFMGYNSIEYGLLNVPLASESTVAFTHPATQAESQGAPRDYHAQPPTNSTSGPLVDATATTIDAWHVADFDLSSTTAAAVQADGAKGQQGGLPPSTSTTGLGAAFGGFGGYIGMSGKGKSMAVQVDGGEVLVVHDGRGIFLGSDGKPSRKDVIQWPAVPDEIAFAKPYIFAILPPGSVPSISQSNSLTAANPVLEIRSVSTLVAVQTLPFPPADSVPSSKGATVAQSAPSIRLLTTSAGDKPPVFLTAIPSDRRILEKDGSAVWRLDMHSWGRQIDELVEKGEFHEALALLDSVDEVILEDKSQRKALVQGLYALTLFSQGKYDDAIDAFTELDINPAKVLALYPPSVAGDLSRSKEDWPPIFGGKKLEATQPSSKDDDAKGATTDALSTSPAPSVGQASARTRFGSLLGGRRPQSVLGEAMGAMLPGAGSGSGGSPSKSATKPRSSLGVETPTMDTAETGSIRSVRSVKDMRDFQNSRANEDSSRKSLDALGRFLADRRRIFKPILENIPQLPSKDRMALSQVKRDSDWLLSLPNKPIGDFEKDELMAVAQTVDTALFKTFLETKPALVGPLCRVENWCEVEQVEELLKDRKKFSELIALYGGKEMHSKALDLLKEFSEKEDDEEEKVGPTVRYLQNLGPEFIDLILETSHWVLEQNPKQGMDIFTADTGKVSSLPRYEIVADLEQFNKDLCAQYLEYIIENAGEADPEMHDKLVLLYLRKAAKSSKSQAKEQSKTERTETMNKLLTFLRKSEQYRSELILGRLPAEEKDRDMFEARALLLGRMGQHEGALGIYVRKLGDLGRAEEYCKDVWASRKRIDEEEARRQAEADITGRGARSSPDGGLSRLRKEADESVFLTLLKIYLRPKDRLAVGGDLMAAAEGHAMERSESSGSAGEDLRLGPALDLIQRHAARLDLKSVLELLPPLVSLSTLESFIRLNLREQTRKQNEARVLRQIRAMRACQVEENLSRLQSRRVKVGETRTCPRCHKRLGNSVIAVQPVTGAVMHYFCMLNGNERP